MKRYEYKLVTQDQGLDRGDIEHELDKHGIEGWELVGIDYGCFFLMREIDAVNWRRSRVG